MRDDFNLDARAFGQTGDLNSGTRGKIVREIFRVNFIHTREIREVGQEHGAFYNVGERQLLVVQNHLHVFQHTLGLDLDIAGNQAAVGGADGNLTGAEQQVTDAHGLIIGAYGRG